MLLLRAASVLFCGGVFSGAGFAGAAAAGADFAGAADFAIDGNRADYCIHADRSSFGDFNFLKNTGGGRGNFGVDFVSGDFEKRFVALDFVAGLLQPLGDCALDDGFAHLGHDDVSRHDFLPCGPRFGTGPDANQHIIAGAESYGGIAG